MVSDKSLVEKLGIQPQYCITIINPPDGFEDQLGDLPDSVRVENFLEEVEFDLIHFFTQEQTELEQQFEYLKNCLNSSGALWVSWPKASSTLTSNLDEAKIRQVGTGGGLKGSRACSLNEDWLALKFIYAKES